MHVPSSPRPAGSSSRSHSCLLQMHELPSASAPLGLGLVRPPSPVRQLPSASASPQPRTAPLGLIRPPSPARQLPSTSASLGLSFTSTSNYSPWPRTSFLSASSSRAPLSLLPLGSIAVSSKLPRLPFPSLANARAPLGYSPRPLLPPQPCKLLGHVGYMHGSRPCTSRAPFGSAGSSDGSRSRLLQMCELPSALVPLGLELLPSVSYSLHLQQGSSLRPQLPLDLGLLPSASYGLRLQQGSSP